MSRICVQAQSQARSRDWDGWSRICRGPGMTKALLWPLFCAAWFSCTSALVHAQAPAPAPGNPALDAGLAALQRGHHATAMRAWRPLAEAGNALAQANIGYLYEHGLGVTQSYVAAMEWYRKAASQNLPQAQFNIGTLYHYGYGVERNLREALNWFRLAARQRLPEAQYMLGLSFHEGHGQPQDAEQALHWFHQAAVQGHGGAQLMAGLVYLSGDAGRADPFKAHVWADIALANGQQDAGLVRDYASYRLSARELARARDVAAECGRSAYQRCPER